MISFLAWYLLAMITEFSVFYSWANEENKIEKTKADKYLPSMKGKKMGKLYYFAKRRHPVRYRAYLIEKITQIMTAIWILLLVLGRMITGSFDFAEETIFVMLPVAIWLFFAPCFSIGIRIYVMIKKHQEKRKNTE